MFRVFALFSFLNLASFASSSEFIYSHLSRLYKSDKSKCLEVSKRYIKLFPSNAAPYYFSSIIYKDRADNARTDRGEGLNIAKAINYAVKFEEKEDRFLQNLVGWENTKIRMIQHANHVLRKIQNEEYLRSRLTLDLLALNAIHPVELEIVELEEVDTKDYSAAFYGMPSGTENVPSASLTGEQQLLVLINSERIKKGMKELQWDEDLARACRYHSYDLATQNYFNHSTYDRMNGKLKRVGNTFDRIRIFYDKSFVNAENIAAGNESPEATYNQWYESKGHYENMFDRTSKYVGIGVYYLKDSPFGFYWTFCTAR